jgi:hypothetical protein
MECTILLKSLHGAVAQPHKVLRTDTIQSLFDRLEPVVGCAVPVLMYRGEVLEPQRTVASYGLCDGVQPATVHQVLCCVVLCCVVASAESHSA